MAEEQLDVALAKVILISELNHLSGILIERWFIQICYEFNADIYGRLQAAYSQLGKRRIAMDQLHMHYTSAIHSVAFNVIHSHIPVDSTSGSKKPYVQLCQQVEDNKLIVCLLQLCQTLWSILRSYNQVVRWHNLNQYKTIG